MHKLDHPYHATLGVMEFALGCALAGAGFRLALMPAGLLDRTSALILSEGGLGWYFASALLFGLLPGLMGAVIAMTYNAIAWRR